MNKIESQFSSIEQLRDQFLNGQSTVKNAPKQDGLSFREILNRKNQEQLLESSSLKFSKHAAGRLQERSIELTEGQISRLQEAAQKAGAKGIQESLVLVDQLAFIVNVPNNTVVTAMDQTETDTNIFTNIDGAVII
ncbi:MAG: flagellar protein [Lachnospiraceae bacterium]|nr:flagellar protein [Lachnospiraceae bacterium]